MCLNYHNEEKIVLRFKRFYHLREKKFCIFQGLIQGPLDPKLTTLPLDHGVSSEVRKKNLFGHYAMEIYLWRETLEIQKFENCRVYSWVLENFE